MPGKFANECDEIAWDMTLTGCDAECGDVQFGDGWFGLLTLSETESATIRAAGAMDTTPAGCIVNEDGQGFVNVSYYDTMLDLMMSWDACEQSTTHDEEG